MIFKWVTGLFFAFVINITSTNCFAQSAADKITGKWISEKKNCIVQVVREKNDFIARLVWFNDDDDKSKPMETRTDYKNPDPALRSRKLIGMDVVDNLVYVPKSNSWENGLIYDAQSGKTWNSSAYLTKDGVLKVTGYWHLKFIGRTMKFYRVP